MSILDFDPLPKKAAVPSQASAAGEVDEWLRANEFKLLKDGDGLTWHLELDLVSQPSPADEKAMDWELRLRLHADVTREAFLDTGTLEAQADARLLSLIGDQTVPLRMRPMLYKAKDEVEARRLMVDLLPKFRENLEKTSLTEVKRSLLGRWIDERSLFSKKY